MAGWLGLYLEDPDAVTLRDRLNEDPEIAFLMPEGPGRWRAVWQVEELLGKTLVWHAPGGPLPLLHPEGGESLIPDPFAGWQELRPGLDPSVPYLGLGWPSTLLLELYTRGWRDLPRREVIPLSGITWYGARPYAQPSPSTRQWWKRFRRWFPSKAVRITRSGLTEGSPRDVWAMPAALRAIQGGMNRDPYPLVRVSPPLRRALTADPLP
jgi:hypothetical protein